MLSALGHNRSARQQDAQNKDTPLSTAHTSCLQLPLAWHRRHRDCQQIAPTGQLGRPIVKAWNAALAATQQTKGRHAGAPDRIAIPVAANSDVARRTVMQLVDDTGFDPFDAGVLAESWRQQPGTPAYCTELNLEELGQALAAAEKDKAPITRDRLMEHFGSLTEAPSLDETVAINRAAHD